MTDQQEPAMHRLPPWSVHERVNEQINNQPRGEAVTSSTSNHETLLETNRRLNRRCQELESIIAHKAEACWWARNRYDEGYRAGIEDSREVRRWQWIAARHGEKNSRLKTRCANLLAACKLALTALHPQAMEYTTATIKAAIAEATGKEE